MAAYLRMITDPLTCQLNGNSFTFFLNYILIFGAMLVCMNDDIGLLIIISNLCGNFNCRLYPVIKRYNNLQIPKVLLRLSFNSKII